MEPVQSRNKGVDTRLSKYAVRTSTHIGISNTNIWVLVMISINTFFAFGHRSGTHKYSYRYVRLCESNYKCCVYYAQIIAVALLEFKLAT